MPSAKVLESKKAIVADLTEKVKNAKAGVIVNYQGIIKSFTQNKIKDGCWLRFVSQITGLKYSFYYSVDTYQIL